MCNVQFPRTICNRNEPKNRRTREPHDTVQFSMCNVQFPWTICNLQSAIYNLQLYNGVVIMSLDFFPLLSFVLISTFTPGPSNIASASMGVLHGYKHTLNYQVGLAAGVFFVMVVSGWVSSAL